LSGTRTLDQYASSNPTAVGDGFGNYHLAFPSITPTAGSWVVGFQGYLADDSSGYDPMIPQSDPGWRVRSSNRTATNAKAIIVETATTAATAATTTPPIAEIWGGALSTGAAPAAVTFSIK